MNVNPKVSVIIPVYNTDKYLNDAIGSIINQTLYDIEIIIIDDGSTDRSCEIIEDLARNDSRIIIISQSNQGQSIARNSGLEIAKGDFIYFMDSDDILEATALESCYHKCLEMSLDLLFFDSEPITEIHTNSIPDVHLTRLYQDIVYHGISLFSDEVEKTLFQSSPCIHFIKREVIYNHHLRFFPGIIHEDNLFTPQLYIHAKRVGLISKPFFQRRIRAGSTMTKRFSMKNVIGYFTVTSELQKIASSSNLETANAIDKYISNMLIAVCYKARYMHFCERISFTYTMLKKNRHYAPLLTIIKSLYPKNE